jgi:hypothetical protein
MSRPELPELSLESWEPTKDSLHLWSQIVGKIQLATTAPRNHWWNVTFRVGPRGIETQLLRHGGTSFRIAFDFIDHALVVTTHRGDVRSFELANGLTVAGFDERLHGLLRELGIDIDILERPFGVPFSATPFPRDTAHASYDPEYAHRWWRVLDWADSVLREFAGWFCGKVSPVHLFWHSYDLAMTRFSGRRAPPLPQADPVTQEAYTHEVISFGFWAGDARMRFPAFYSYTAPEPAKLREQPLHPASASWQGLQTSSMAILPYEAVRTAADPRSTLLAFLQSAYEAGARAAGWERDELLSSWCPAPEALEALARQG